MPTIKNVSTHVEDLHDGRPIEAYATRRIDVKHIDDDHYVQRIADGVFLRVDDPPTKTPAKAKTTTTEGD